MKMPYGKYKGREIEDLPSSYLLWVAENWREDSERDRQICEAADKEFQKREKARDHFEEDLKDVERIRRQNLSRVRQAVLRRF